MNARNPSDSSHGGEADNTPPVMKPDHKDDVAGLEVVWSSPVQTGTSFGSSLRNESASPQMNQAADTGWVGRHVFAFESDLLDNAFVHWDQEKPTLEMIPGFKKDHQPEADILYPAESVASGLSSLLPDGTNGFISIVGPEAMQYGDKSLPFQPDVSKGVAGPNKVRDDGIEDAIAGWRPTGMVFFETLATPPRGTVYSSSMLDAFRDELALKDERAATIAGSNLAMHTAASAGTRPFFDFPDDVQPAPPDDTDDFHHQEEIVIKGGSGGGDGTRVIRLFVKLVILAIASLILILVAVGGTYAWYIKQRLYDAETPGRDMTFTIKPGESFSSIVNGMSKDGMLKSFMGLDDRYLMRYLAYAYENSNKIKPGVYRFNSGQNLNDVYNKLISGSKDYKITIAEGKTAQEIAELVAKQYKHFDSAHFMELVNDPTFIKSVGVDAPSLEGYLYPSTYYFGPGMKEEELAKLMVATFQDKLDGIEDKVTTNGLTLQEHVIMASLIEREARLDEDRPLIASVIYNRLEQGIPLQIDATVNFALGSWRRLTNADYKVESPYNTYKIKGLPPGPITSPRIESLLATYQAPETRYLYYVHRGDGHHAFAETYAQHQANVGRYIREKNASGMGNAPSAEIEKIEKTMVSSDHSDSKEPAVDMDVETKQPSIAGKPDEPAPKSDIKVEDVPEKTNGADDSKKDDETRKEQKKTEVEKDGSPAAPKSY